MSACGPLHVTAPTPPAHQVANAPYFSPRS